MTRISILALLFLASINALAEEPVFSALAAVNSQCRADVQPATLYFTWTSTHWREGAINPQAEIDDMDQFLAQAKFNGWEVQDQKSESRGWHRYSFGHPQDLAAMVLQAHGCAAFDNECRQLILLGNRSIDESSLSSYQGEITLPVQTVEHVVKIKAGPEFGLCAENGQVRLVESSRLSEMVNQIRFNMLAALTSFHYYGTIISAGGGH
jgi:hypothetical protein